MKPGLTRRSLLARAGALSLGLRGLRLALDRDGVLDGGEGQAGFGPLRPDPQRIFDLPEGFRYRVFGRTGESMDDGLLLPGAHDGSASFAGSGGKTILIRNHELTNQADKIGAFGVRGELLQQGDRQRLFDAGGERGPALGGTTTTVLDTASGRVESQFLSLGGTVRNCAGGATPWGTWVTCEEAVFRAGKDGYVVDHGYNFEVRPELRPQLQQAAPLYDMGRFNHEAVAVDPRTGIVYQTEDRHSSLFYRYIPRVPGQLARGGRLQALVLRDKPGAHTNNHKAAGTIPRGKRLAATWIDINNPRSPRDDLRKQGFSRGAARFVRGEGMWWGQDEIWFTCTIGGPAKKGQIWRYLPDLPGKDQDPGSVGGQLELFLEPNDSKVLDMGDNITVSPFGDLFVCEDGPDQQFLVGVTPGGQTYRFGHNAANKSELTGVHFSPDGRTMFVNVQRPGYSLAITGDWQRRG